jgi:hypothetical protein
VVSSLVFGFRSTSSDAPHLIRCRKVRRPKTDRQSENQSLSAQAKRRSANYSPTSGVGALVEAARRLHVRASDQRFLPIRVEDYVTLLDWTGRALRADERGAIPAHLARIVVLLRDDVVDLKGQNVERLREPAVFAGVFAVVPNQTFQFLVHRIRRPGKRARSMRSGEVADRSRAVMRVRPFSDR